MPKRKIHNIQIPGVLLDAIRDDDRYENDDRFKKRKTGKEKLSRKERRKLERKEKKHNRSHKHNENEEKPLETEEDSNGHNEAVDAESVHRSASITEDDGSFEFPKNERDNDDIKYYAKKLGINPKEGLHKTDEFDTVGGLLDGLDFMDKYGGKEEKSDNTPDGEVDEEEEDQSDMDKEAALLEYDDENKDMDEQATDYYAKKLGIDTDEGLKEEFEGDVLGGLLEGISAGTDKQEKESAVSEEESSEEESSDDTSEPVVKENPYIAPEQSHDDEDDDDDKPTEKQDKYIPPRLRKRLMAENSESSEMVELKRAIKGPFNKLSEPTLGKSVSELLRQYDTYPRQLVNEAIVDVVLDSVLIRTPLLESFLILYASAVTAVFRLHGIDFGAFAIQSFVEKLETYWIPEKQTNKRAAVNLIGLIGFCYDLGMISPTLIYDIISKKLLISPDEFKIDMLLKLIRTSGPKLRSDDSMALKEITTNLTKSVKEEERHGNVASVRTKFVIETITNLKNNKLKSIESRPTGDMLTRVRKQLGSLGGSYNGEAIKVSLDDIEHVKDRGKWWLVGSAWKGTSASPSNDHNEISNEKSDESDNLNIDDDIFDGQTNWLALAKEHRMNTDVRKAIFVSIMSAADYMDAFTKLDKLKLKNVQKREIPNILLHCATLESVYNPYYAFLAKKLCADHAMKRTLKLNLWDLFKDLNSGDDTVTGLLTESEGVSRLSKVLHLGRFYGFLIGKGAQELNVLKTVNFIELSSDARIFVTILLITFLDIVSKKSMKGHPKNPSTKLVTDVLSKCDDQISLLKGLRYFIENGLKDSDLIKDERQKRRVYWGSQVMYDEIGKMI